MMEMFGDGTDRDPEDFSAVATVPSDDDDDGDYRWNIPNINSDFLRPWIKISSRKVRPVRLRQIFMFSPAHNHCF